MKAIRSTYQKQANEKLTPDEVRVLTRGLVEQGIAVPVVASRWALILSVVAFLMSCLALIVAART